MCVQMMMLQPGGVTLLKKAPVVNCWEFSFNSDNCGGELWLVELQQYLTSSVMAFDSLVPVGKDSLLEIYQTLHHTGEMKKNLPRSSNQV